MIQVKNQVRLICGLWCYFIVLLLICCDRSCSQIWVGCDGQNDIEGQLRSQLFVVDLDSLTVEKELLAHSDSIQTLCSAEDRYILSGSACRDGKIAIWKVE